MPTTPDSKTEKALDAIERIRRAVCEGHRTGFNDEMRIIDANAPRRAREKILSLAGWLDVLFSAKKHQKYGKGIAGREFARQQAFADLARLSSIVRVGEAEDEPEGG